MPIAPGTRLGPYVVQESIGQGAMGVVYRAYHAQLERTGAVKVLQALSPDEDTTARFRQEAQAIAHMRHPNVLNVFDFGEHEGTPYMIVEYVEGGSLSARMKRSSVSPAEALHYLRGVGSALDYAHSLGIVHRDVKPANVLLGPKDTPILADFGLAKLLQSSSIKSITGVTTGTPAYMAPEQVTGSEVGPAADRYSLAVMAFEMLSGSLPFDDAGVLEVLYAHVHREAPNPSSRNATLTGRVDAIILRGLDKNPQARWETCEAFVAALESSLLPATRQPERTVVIAPPVPAVAAPAVAVAAPAAAVAVAEKVVPATATVMAPMPAPVPAEPKRKRRRGLMWIGATVLAVLLFLSVTAAFIVGRTPRISVTLNVAAPGQLVRVTAANIPANQTGELQMHSVIYTYEFRANASGQLDQVIQIPIDIELGDHRIDLCWNNACRASTHLRIAPGGGGVALASPSTTPSSAQSPTPQRSPSPQGTPRTTPKSTPGSTPSSNPTHRPSPNPSPHPSPTPTSNPCPGNLNMPVLTPPSQTILALGGTARFTGANFTPNGTVTVTYTKGSNAPVALPSVTANCKGNIAVSATIPGGLARTDKIVVCDPVKPCVTETVTVL